MASTYDRGAAVERMLMGEVIRNPAMYQRWYCRRDIVDAALAGGLTIFTVHRSMIAASSGHAIYEVMVPSDVVGKVDAYVFNAKTLIVGLFPGQGAEPVEPLYTVDLSAAAEPPKAFVKRGRILNLKRK